MEIMNVVPHKTVVIPEIFIWKIELRFMCSLSDKELSVFGLCLQLCEKILIKDGIQNSDLSKATIIFADSGELVLREDDYTYGSHFSLIIYNMNKIRIFDNMMKTALLFVEELVHHYWRIEDETLVKYKDIEILKLANSSYSIELLKEWKVNWK